MIHPVFNPDNLLRLRDPGLLRIRKALRTTFAAALSLALLALVARHIPLLQAPTTFTLAGSMTIQLMLLNTGRTRRIQQAAMLLSAAMMLLSAMLLHFLAPWPASQSILMCAIAFPAFYARRYGPHFIGIGLSSMISFMIIAIMMHNNMPARAILITILATAAIAFPVNFYFFPDRPERSYRDSIARQMKLAAGHVRAIREALATSPPQPYQAMPAVHDLQKAIATTQQIALFLPIDEATELTTLDIMHLRSAGTLQVLAEAIEQALQTEGPFSGQVRNALIAALEALDAAFLAAIPAVRIHHPLDSQALDKLEQNVEELTQAVEKAPDLFSKRFFPLSRALFALRRFVRIFRAWPFHVAGVPR